MNISDEIARLIANPDAPIDREWLDEVGREYPYFTLPAVLALQRKAACLDDSDRQELLSKVAIACPDRLALYNLVGENAANFAAFYPHEPEPETLSTDTTIETFLDKYGAKSNEKEMEVLNQMIFNPTPDYAEVLVAQEAHESNSAQGRETPSQEDAMISDFIAKSREQEGRFPTTVVPRPEVSDEDKAKIANEPINEPETPHDTTLSESLAKIYIKQHKYSKALEIIQGISLKFPEKSIYFADQIRFLKKLVLNEQIINKK